MHESHKDNYTALQTIDLAAAEDRLYHYNGGQAFIRLHKDHDLLLYIDHAVIGSVRIQILDGTQYFNTYANMNFEHSERVRNHGSLALWFESNFAPV